MYGAKAIARLGKLYMELPEPAGKGNLDYMQIYEAAALAAMNGNTETKRRWKSHRSLERRCQPLDLMLWKTRIRMETTNTINVMVVNRTGYVTLCYKIY